MTEQYCLLDMEVDVLYGPAVAKFPLKTTKQNKPPSNCDVLSYIFSLSLCYSKIIVYFTLKMFKNYNMLSFGLDCSKGWCLLQKTVIYVRILISGLIQLSSFLFLISLQL